ncbi:MAG: type II toxin-antitoxin system HicB family antitoxin [Thermomicrobiales bacterium]
MTRYTYTVLLVPEPDAGGYSVEVPALPGCVTQGDTIEEALAMAQNAVSMWLRDMTAEGEPIPVERVVPRLMSIEVDAPQLVGA